MLKHKLYCILTVLACLVGGAAQAQNPIITNQFTADPTARLFNGRVYVYPSHDIPAAPGRGRAGWFVMEDYHVFSSANLTDWTDHGVIVTQNKVPWVKPDSYSMWAPDCIARNGKYYFYFPTTPKDTTINKGFTVGVAVADKPTGPFMPEPQPIKGVRGIDPNVFIDQDGQAYLYWSQGNIYGAKLKENMLELASEPVTLGELPTKGLKEGPYLFKRNGTYYLTYPHVANKTERLEYATSTSPLGPFTVKGVLMDESPTGCWTNHHSLLEVKNQWYLFYHHNDLSPTFDKNRSVRIDSLFFEPDGTIRKVVPTLRGVGLTDARQKIQLDRYSRLSSRGASIAFLDTSNTFQGWKTVFANNQGWVQYNDVAFGKQALKTVTLRVQAAAGATVQLRTDGATGPLLAQVTVPKSSQWQEIKAPVSAFKPGTHALVVSSKTNTPVAIDWVKFD
ncbi:family 43 glycosylhydrolase [Hymenobacter taeanensis]|uniref:Family 43 glycosylhydrolase n=1 Tax=Hymenobacter taeanensis TaxID=2735321 RepID=A0A6M6BLT7_9BACT|nr:MULTISPECIES: family 43 glycosylhydrolase [Hymenobacter]QJX48942.1 family 43 glycosylhydrolase [Hymenobacter taeanensis]UOQ81542.1 family 43 glycosylhydrolase [Hymenobacter sp. 5414T-23]